MEKNSFKTLHLAKDILQTLDQLDYKYMTEVQEKSLPFILQQKDTIAKAKTGSGKTVSFGLGIINNLDTLSYKVQGLVLCPTRELASQVSLEIKKLLRKKENIKVLSLTGGVPYKPQVHSLRHKAHIIVGTPGRVLKHLKEENLKVEHVNSFVLDEADRMLDMGFYDDIMEIASYLPQKKHTMLFSATYPSNIENLASKITNEAVFIEVESKIEQSGIEQLFYDTRDTQKETLVPRVLRKEFKSVIIFCNTKLQCEELADFLEDNYQIEPLVLHSDLEQKYRDETLVLFQNKSYPVLIATDLASRGLDIKEVDLVINYDMPENPEVYIHRIGRTARAGTKGEAVSFCDDMENFDDLVSFLGKEYELLDAIELEKKEAVNPGYDYSTIYISGGKKLKLRAGDILGALTAGIGCHRDDIGKIDIFDRCSYVAIKNEAYEKAYEGLRKTKIKNKDFRVYKR